MCPGGDQHSRGPGVRGGGMHPTVDTTLMQPEIPSKVHKIPDRQREGSDREADTQSPAYTVQIDRLESQP